ncbi:MAG: hypothetical protein K0S12_833 [Bacteroidetes bacterium]|jgi:hypothetical protein|nr:hypothetical protein [Bacteroidota bacterium]
MRKNYISSLFIILATIGLSQNWQFVKPFHQQNSANHSNWYSPGKIKQLSTGDLIRYSADGNRSILQGYNASGDSLWYHKIKHLYISDLTVIGNTAAFCGWIDSVITLGSQSYSCPDTCSYGILGVINSSGVFSDIKLIKAHETELWGIAYRNDVIALTGGYKKYAKLDTIMLTGPAVWQTFVATLDTNLNFKKAGYTSGIGDGSATGIGCNIDDHGNIWVMATTFHGLIWNINTASYPFNGGTTTNGQQLFKLDSSLHFVWNQILFSGIGPEVYEPAILTDSNSAVVASRFSWGSGAGSHNKVRKFAADGSVAWAKTLSPGNAIVGMDNKRNVYSCTLENKFTLYKFSPDGTQLYAASDTSWKHMMFEWDFTNEDEFYGLGSCNGNQHNCISGKWFFAHYKLTAPMGAESFSSDKVDLDVYPNPSNGRINIKLIGESGNMDVRVINLFGQMIHSDPSCSGVIDLSNEANGVYFIQVDSNGMKSTRKIILNKK